MRALNFLPLVVLTVIVLVAKSGLFTAGATTAGLGLLLLILCLWPAVAWVVGGMRHLPLFEIYCFMHLTYYWVPAGKIERDILNLGEDQRALVLGVLNVFLLCGQVVYFGLLRGLRRGQARQWRFWSNRVPLMTGVKLPWVLLLVSLAYSYGFHTGLLWDFIRAFIPWQWAGLLRSLTTVMGLLGLFVLGLKAGRGDISKFHMVVFGLAVLASALLNFASGFLVMGTVFAGNAFFAYTLGARRLPAVALVSFLLFVSFLNYGKGEMRQRYWQEGETDDLVEMYSYWFNSAWEQINLPVERRSSAAISAFERADLTTVCVAMVTQSPTPIPYLNGQTYLDSLALFVPRALWPNRPDLHTMMGELGLRYGIHLNYESTQNTVITLGQIGEAWANGGWLAVGLVGAFFGGLFYVGVRVAYGRGQDTVGFLMGMTFAGFTVSLEPSTITLLMSLNQTLVVSLAMLYFLSRPVVSGQKSTPHSGQTVCPAADDAPAPVAGLVSPRESHP